MPSYGSPSRFAECAERLANCRRRDSGRPGSCRGRCRADAKQSPARCRPHRKAAPNSRRDGSAFAPARCLRARRENPRRSSCSRGIPRAGSRGCRPTRPASFRRCRGRARYRSGSGSVAARRQTALALYRRVAAILREDGAAGIGRVDVHRRDIARQVDRHRAAYRRRDLKPPAKPGIGQQEIAGGRQIRLVTDLESGRRRGRSRRCGRDRGRSRASASDAAAPLSAACADPARLLRRAARARCRRR